jgi:hypothetical protein
VVSALDSLIREHRDAGIAEDLIADIILKGCPAKWADLVLPAVTDRVRMVVRADSRRVESGHVADVDPVSGDTTVRPALRASLLVSTFACGADMHFVRVAWGEATVAHHLSRQAMLRAQQAGIVDTFNRHQRAVDLIEARRVACLNDIDDESMVTALIQFGASQAVAA